MSSSGKWSRNSRGVLVGTVLLGVICGFSGRLLSAAPKDSEASPRSVGPLIQLPRKAEGFRGPEGSPSWVRPSSLSQEFFGDRVPSQLQVVVDAPDLEVLRHEDEERLRRGDRQFRTGVAVSIDHDPLSPGEWRDDGRGGRFWSMELFAPGAVALRIRFEGFELPREGRVVVYPASDPDAVFGPYQDKGIHGDGDFWSHDIQGDHLVVEYSEPRGPATPADLQKLPFRIDRVMFDYRTGFEESSSARGAGSCHLDSSCSSAFSELREATGRVKYITSNTQFVCSGSLLTTIAFDRSPLMVTANHCIATPSTAATVDVAWRYWTGGCGGSEPNLNAVPHSLSATLLDTHIPTDFSLLVLEGAVPPNLFWAGWDASAQPGGEDVVAIHHPGGVPQKISFGTIDSSCNSTTEYCVFWDAGVVENGSSGSPLYNEANAYCGVASFGDGNCNQSHLEAYYGRFDRAFSSVGHWFIAGTDDSFETNDTCGAASLVVPGSYPDLVVKIDDEDWYQVNVAPFERAEVSFDFVHVNGNLDVWAFEGCGGGVEDVAASFTDGELIVLENESSGFASYFLRVRVSGDTRQTYDMDVAVMDCGIAEDVWEDNDLCPQARSLGATTYPGLFVQELDEDWFRVGIPPYSSTRIEAFYDSQQANLKLELRDGCGGPILDFSSGGLSSEVVEATNLTGSTRFVYPRVYVDASIGRPCTTYDLEISHQRCRFDDTNEEDDSCSSGTLIGEGRIDNLQASPGDPDWFRIIVPAGGTLDFDLFFSHFSDDLDLRLFEGCGGSPVDVSLTTTNNESVSVRNLAGGDVLYNAEVKLVSGDCNQYDVEAFITANQAPAQPVILSAPTKFYANAALVLRFVAMDPELDDVTYTVDWGDGLESVIGPRASGASVSTLHPYPLPGIYEIRVKARDLYGFESGFSIPISVDIADVENRRGNVGADSGLGTFNVLSVNGEVGSVHERRVDHDVTNPLTVFLDAGPFGPSQPIYAVWGWAFSPGSADLRVLPQGLGVMGANPLLGSCGSRCPTYAATTVPLSFCVTALCSTTEATLARPPATILVIPAGVLSPGGSVYFQGVIRDASDTSGRGFSVTNAVEVRLE